MVEVSIVGVSGYGGGELVRLLARHPEVRIVQAISDGFAGKPLAAAFAGLHGTDVGGLICQPKSTPVEGEVVFLAQDNGYAMKVAGELLAARRRVIDLAADFRLTDTEQFRRFYKMEPAAPELMAQAVYGLPERHRAAIVDARLIANPGCNSTATILALAPLVDRGLIETRGVVVDIKAGVSGAGRSKSDTIYRYAEMNDTVRPYNVGGVHRHIAEIEQEAGLVVTFTPHLVPMTRGILATCCAPVKDGVTAATITEGLRESYAGCPFVIVREPGDWPSTKDVWGTNFCHLAATVDTRTGMASVISVIDNLGKGAAGQAVQNLNLMCGLPETAGLEGTGLWP